MNQKIVFQRLKRNYENNRLSHAYLFVGEVGTSKYQTALHFAQMLYCNGLDKPCGVCSNCRTIYEGLHQNVIIVSPLEQTIKKEQILNLINELSRSSLVNGPRVFIINQADKMTASAANSLLKVIEEPINDIYWILITDNESLILPTILSRVQQIKFPKIDVSLYHEELIEMGIDEAYIPLLNEITNNPEEAKNVFSELSKITNIVKNILNAIIMGQSTILVIDKSIDDLQDDKRNFSFLMQVLFLVYVDIARIQKGETNIINKYLRNEIVELAGKAGYQAIIKNIDVIIKYQNYMRYNVNSLLVVKQTIEHLEMGC